MVCLVFAPRPVAEVSASGKTSGPSEIPISPWSQTSPHPPSFGCVPLN